MRPPIRIGIVGLSTSAAASWASVAHLPYLLSARGQTKYKITALCNTSVESATRARDAFGLSPDVKPYGNASELALDPDVDLVVCNVRVDRHYDIIRPSLLAGKAVFCEWPLASSLAQARELVGIARDSGSRTMVGTQGRVSPIVAAIKDVLQQGRIGKVLSSEMRVAGGVQDRLLLSSFMDYFVELKVGGNLLTIGGGHLLDSMQYALGDLHDVQSTLQIQRPQVPLIDRQTKQTIATVTSDVPDLIIVTGTLKESSIVTGGATAHFRLRRGQPFPGEDAIVWSINCERAELRMSSSGAAVMQIGSQKATIMLHDHHTDEVREVQWQWQDWQEHLAAAGRNTGMLYDRFYGGLEHPRFETAVKTHETLGEIMKAGSL